MWIGRKGNYATVRRLFSLKHIDANGVKSDNIIGKENFYSYTTHTSEPLIKLKNNPMEDIIKTILDKPLAFIITLSGVLFLGLSGMTRVFKIEIDTKNSIRLFIVGISLVIIGIPIYYFGENQFAPDLDVKLLNVELFRNDRGHYCDESFLHVRETFQINNSDGESLTKVILSKNNIISQEIMYQDNEGNFAVNYCFEPDFERFFRIVIISSSGKTSNVIRYKVNSKDVSQIQENAPRLVKY